MPGETKKVVGTSHFQIDLSGLDLTNARSVSGFNINFEEMHEQTATEGKVERHRFPTAGPIWTELTIERALKPDMSLWDWFKQSHIDGNWESLMKEGTLTLFNHKHDPVLVYGLTEVWPTSYGVPALDAGGGGMATESLGIVAKFERQ